MKLNNIQFMVLVGTACWLGAPCLAAEPFAIVKQPQATGEAVKARPVAPMPQATFVADPGPKTWGDCVRRMVKFRAPSSWGKLRVNVTWYPMTFYRIEAFGPPPKNQKFHGWLYANVKKPAEPGAPWTCELNQSLASKHTAMAFYMANDADAGNDHVQQYVKNAKSDAVESASKYYWDVTVPERGRQEIRREHELRAKRAGLSLDDWARAHRLSP